MPAMQSGQNKQDSGIGCIDVSLQAADSRMLASDGREIPFTRAVLTVRNTCSAEAIDLVLHATLGQEGGTVQDVTHAIALPEAGPVLPGVTVSWDVYDVLLPAHQGTASKIHMFGYRAALNWRFELAAWAEVRGAAGSPPVQTPVSRWALRWTVPDPSTGGVVLAIEEGKD